MWLGCGLWLDVGDDGKNTFPSLTLPELSASMLPGLDHCFLLLYHSVSGLESVDHGLKAKNKNSSPLCD